MICACIRGPSLDEAASQCEQAVPFADLVEIRIDLLEDHSQNDFKALLDNSPLPVILTLRSQAQGGAFKGSKEQHRQEICRLASLKPAYLDIECGFPSHDIEKLATMHPEVKLILSYHDFEKTPDDLDQLFDRMQSKSVYWYKLAFMAKTTLDMLRLMDWAKGKKNLIAISMGEYGMPSRLIGPVMGCPLTMGCLDDGMMTAPAQIAVRELSETYRIRGMNRSTLLLGLIGDPVDKSISHYTHNRLMGSLDMNGVYVKMRVKPEELSEFFKYIKELPFKGLSVTMPLKEHVLQQLDHIDPLAQAIGAVNTIRIDGGKTSGYNTDAMGALNALEAEGSVKGQQVVIIGAGGAAKAIAYEVQQRGASVTIVNRDAGKAEWLASRLGCHWHSLADMSQCRRDGYDILINTTPVEMPIEEHDILPGAKIMDIKTRPLHTTLTTIASDKGCKIVYGYRMFVEQAIGQYAIWFDQTIDIAQFRTVLNKESEEILFS